MSRSGVARGLLAVAWLAATLAPPCVADDAAPIKLGMSTALSGPARQLGLNMKAGIEAALEEANRGGGVGGRPLVLIAMDDGYEPARTAPNMRALVEDEQVVAIIGNVGTPTAVAAIPIANESGTPFFGAFTGAGVLRKPKPDRYVINYRASYAEETEAMVDALIIEADLRPEEIAFFTQRDAYGDAGFVGGIAALKRHGLRDDMRVAHGRYERNTVTVEDGLAEILEADPPARAVIMVGAYAPCARFITLAREFGLDALFLNVSFVGAAPLARELGPAGEGVIVTQVVPHVDADLPIVKAFRAAIAASDPGAEPTFGSLEGYIAATILLRALRSIHGPVERESIVTALEGLGTFDIGLGDDVRLFLGPGHHQACSTVWPTRISNGAIVSFSWRSLRPGATTRSPGS